MTLGWVPNRPKFDFVLAKGPKSRTGSAGEALAVELLDCACMGELGRTRHKPPLGETGAADLWASADLRFLVCVFGVLDCGFVVLCFVSLGDSMFSQIVADRSR